MVSISKLSKHFLTNAGISLKFRSQTTVAISNLLIFPCLRSRLIKCKFSITCLTGIDVPDRYWYVASSKLWIVIATDRSCSPTLQILSQFSLLNKDPFDSNSNLTDSLNSASFIRFRIELLQNSSPVPLDENTFK